MNDLGQVSPFHRRAKLNFTGTVLVTQQAFNEGGLTCAVITQQGDPFTALHIQFHIGKEGSVTKGFGHILHLKYHITGEILFSEGGLHMLFRLRFFCLADTLHPVLNGHGATEQGAVIDAPALHTLHSITQLLQFGLFLLVLLHLQIKTGLLFVHIEGIVAGIELRMAIGDLNDPVCYTVDKIAVMGDSQNRSLEGIDIALQPFYAV